MNTILLIIHLNYIRIDKEVLYPCPVQVSCKSHVTLLAEDAVQMQGEGMKTIVRRLVISSLLSTVLVSLLLGQHFGGWS